MYACQFILYVLGYVVRRLVIMIIIKSQFPIQSLRWSLIRPPCQPSIHPPASPPLSSPPGASCPNGNACPLNRFYDVMITSDENFRYIATSQCPSYDKPMWEKPNSACRVEVANILYKIPLHPTRPTTVDSIPVGKTLESYNEILYLKEGPHRLHIHNSIYIMIIR